jgi:MFS family permease
MGLFDSWFVFGAALLASMGGFSFGYDQGVISVINVMPQFHAAFPDAATPFGKGFMTGMLEFGAFIGCLFMPALADKISRKRAIVVVVIIFNVGAIMQTAATSYGVLVAGRAIGGIGVGTLAMVGRALRVNSCLHCDAARANTHQKQGSPDLHIGNCPP